MTERDAEIDIDIRIEAEGWRAPEIRAEQLTREAAGAVLKHALPGSGGIELSVLLTDDSGIAALNAAWRGRSGPTNVLSFPGDSPDAADQVPDVPVLLGDIAIALETVTREADATGIELSDHLRHLVVHGVLHLLGYDHEDETDADRMERCEIEILAALGVPDPYAAADRRLEHACP